MRHKKIRRPDRLRQVPAQFRWLAQRLGRENFLRHGEPPAGALYLGLVTVADAQGLRYYSDATLSRWLKLAPLERARGRQPLIAAELVADHKPLDQGLAGPAAATPASAPRVGQSLSVGEILRRARAGGAA